MCQGVQSAESRAQFSEACRIRIEFFTGCDPALSSEGVDLAIQCSLSRRVHAQLPAFSSSGRPYADILNNSGIGLAGH